ncbi:MAG: ABC transporter substrate-binding protein, partial [Candidatus Methanomethylophilaceae archaeon]|nr:ABC transporter substrate-binding protein [Candidatus Methanomethylophilaceae archaeon]
METKTKMLAVVAVIIMVAAGGIYLLDGGETDADITIACGTKNYYEPFWIADHYGYFEEQGVSVKMLYVDGGGSATTALMAGRADITLVGADPAVRFIDQTHGGMIIGSISVNKSSTAYDFAALTKYGVDLDDPVGTLLNTDGTVRVHTGIDTTTGYFGGFRGYLYSAWQDGKLTEDQYNLLRSVKTSDKDGGIVHIQFDSQVTALLQDQVQMLCSGNALN